jgi:hypothetical protein
MTMQPMTREQYQQKVANYVAMAREWLTEEPTPTRESVVHDLHEWLSAPDSFFYWHDGDDVEVALDVLRHTSHRDAGVTEGRGEGIGLTDAEELLGYLAAWAFVWDVLAALDEGASR